MVSKIMKLIKYRVAKKRHNFQHCCIWLHDHWLWSHLGFFYYSKVEFTTLNTFSNVTGFSHFTMVNTDLVCCGGNGGRMKARYGLLLIFLNFVYSVDSLSHYLRCVPWVSRFWKLIHVFLTPPEYSFSFFAPNSTVEMSQQSDNFCFHSR